MVDTYRVPVADADRIRAGLALQLVAAATGISPSGTRSRLERLVKRLREDLGDG